MKKTWTLIALAAALCVSCSDDDKSCTEGAAFCKSGDNNTTVLVTCENGELNETVCNTGYICDSKKKMCTVAAECSNDMKPSCDQANNRIVYCSNNVITYTDCANGCSVETNKCNPATAGKGVCTAGAKRCNQAGEREICSAAGVWESKPCCDKDDSACLLTCHSGECMSSYKDGATRCMSDSEYQEFKDGEWSKTMPCPEKHVCAKSKDACVKINTMYRYCDNACGEGKVGYCFRDRTDTKDQKGCAKVCSSKDIGTSYGGCVDGGDAMYGVRYVCTVIGETHYAYLMDAYSVERCKNGCNADNTGCGDSGSSGGGSTGSSSYTYCGEVDVELKNGQQMKLQAACDQMNGAGKTIGVCIGTEIGCINVCQKADVGKTVPVCDIYGTTSGGQAPFAGQAVCTDLSDGTHYGLVEDDSTFKNCKNACNTEGTACDSQGFAEGGSGGGDSSSTNYAYCGDQTIEVEYKDGTKKKMTLQEACDEQEGKGKSVGVCAGTKPACMPICNKTDEGKTTKTCVVSGENSAEYQYKCTKLDETHYANLVDATSAKLCKNVCASDGKGCDDKGYYDSVSQELVYCPDKQLSNGKKFQEYCDSMLGEGKSMAMCTGSGETVDCYKTCTAQDEGKSIDACYNYGTTAGDLAVKETCTSVGVNQYLYIDDPGNGKKCTNGCNPENTACK